MDSDKIKIHRIVYGECSYGIKPILDSWNLVKERYNIITWNKEDIYKFYTKEFPDYLDVLSNFSNVGEISDFCRLGILYKFGGIYVDWDVELKDVRLLDTLLNKHPNGYLVFDKSLNAIAIEHFYLPPNCSLLLDVMNDISRVSRSGVKDSILYYTGNHRFTSVFRKNHYDIQLIDIHDVFTHNYRERMAGLSGNNTAPMKHYWMHTWKTNSNSNIFA